VNDIKTRNILYASTKTPVLGQCIVIMLSYDTLNLHSYISLAVTNLSSLMSVPFNQWVIFQITSYKHAS